MAVTLFPIAIAGAIQEIKESKGSLDGQKTIMFPTASRIVKPTPLTGTPLIEPSNLSAQAA